MDKSENTISHLKEEFVSLDKKITEEIFAGNIEWPSTKKEIENLYSNDKLTTKVIAYKRKKCPDGKTICIFEVFVQGEDGEGFGHTIIYDIPDRMVKEDEEEIERKKAEERKKNLGLSIMLLAAIVLFKFGYWDLVNMQNTPVQIEETANYDNTIEKGEEQNNFSYYLLNRKTKTLIAQKDEERDFNTKIYDNMMTTLFVLEKLTLDQMKKTVTVTSSELANVGNSEYTINLVEGEEITINSLLDALLLVSADDAREVLKTEVEKVTGESYETMLEKKEQFVFQGQQFSNAKKLSVLFDYVINRSYIGNWFKNIVKQQEYVKSITNTCKSEVHFRKMFESSFMEKEGINIYCIYAKDNGKGACVLFCAENRENKQIIGTVYSDNTDKNKMQIELTKLIHKGFELLKIQDGIGENEGNGRS